MDVALSRLRLFAKLLLGFVVVFAHFGAPAPARAETIYGAMGAAYVGNPTLNAQRAANRVANEGVPLALSALRPSIIGSADYGYSRSSTSGVTTNLTPGGFGVTISQTLFDSMKTANNVAAAEAAIQASRETLRNTEQNVLFDAASAYMDVLRDQAIASFRTQNLAFLEEEVRAARARFDVGESTRTDVEQARARRAAAVAELSAAQGSLKSSIAVYRQVIGRDPANLQPARGIGARLPRSQAAAVAIAMEEHPAIQATWHLVDQATYNVKAAESDLLPTISLEGTARRRYDAVMHDTITNSLSITSTLRVPIYQGGRVSATVRQNKETLGQRRIEVDQSVDSVRAAVVSAFAQLESARASVEAGNAQLAAANLALDGIVEERNVGQRTTLDVLNTRQDVINAQISLTRSRRDVVVAGYALLSAIGRLSAAQLGLKVEVYQPDEHYHAVRDKWYGLRTPDQR